MYLAVRIVEQRAVQRWRGNPDPAAGALAPDPEALHDAEVSDGARLRVGAWAAGPPVLLVHGITANWQDWRATVAHLLTAGHRVLALDLRGHGASTLGAERPGTARLAADLREVLEALDLRDAVLVGHSLGGYLSLAVAAAHRDAVRGRIRRIVLVGATATMRRPRELAVLLGNGSPLTPALQRHPRRGRMVMRLLGFGVRPSLAAVDDVRLRWSRCPMQTRVAFALSLAGDSLVGRLGQVDVPVLAVHGTHDRITPARRSTLIARRVPHGASRCVEGPGHALPRERPAELARLIHAGEDAEHPTGERPR